MSFFSDFPCSTSLCFRYLNAVHFFISKFISIRFRGYSLHFSSHSKIAEFVFVTMIWFDLFSLNSAMLPLRWYLSSSRKNVGQGPCWIADEFFLSLDALEREKMNQKVSQGGKRVTQTYLPCLSAFCSLWLSFSFEKERHRNKTIRQPFMMKLSLA